MKYLSETQTLHHVSITEKFMFDLLCPETKAMAEIMQFLREYSLICNCSLICFCKRIYHTLKSVDYKRAEFHLFYCVCQTLKKTKNNTKFLIFSALSEAKT